MQVQLQDSPGPFTAAMTNTGTPVATDATGHYTFTVQPSLNTRYQVVAATNPLATSPTVDVLVRFKVGLRVSDTKVRRGQRVRFKGSVAPARTGRVKIQRRTSTGFKTVARAALRGSKYAKEAADPAQGHVPRARSGRRDTPARHEPQAHDPHRVAADPRRMVAYATATLLSDRKSPTIG